MCCLLLTTPVKLWPVLVERKRNEQNETIPQLSNPHENCVLCNIEINYTREEEIFPLLVKEVVKGVTSVLCALCLYIVLPVVLADVATDNKEGEMV